jgi:hypothetical protein
MQKDSHLLAILKQKFEKGSFSMSRAFASGAVSPRYSILISQIIQELHIYD